ncbi:uncharacterized protein LOC129728442 [Wyeomyia smithii]|uniref:uncharacterized protein LOC129728442 n=1 Tax=Wyeomyia smithii TaxID=174621 RepID=UPI0024681BF6|nr:uncharacterized protein LOC129728442 [Wyeomyia smithii]
MSNAKAVTTPMNAAGKLTKELAPQTPEEIERMKVMPYQEAVGCLMYLAQCTRPDILFAVNLMSRFNTNPGLRHWEAVKHIFRYLKGTSKMMLQYSVTGDSKLIGYTDADWASDLDDRRSTSGYVFVMQGGAVSWSCRRQTTVSLLTLRSGVHGPICYGTRGVMVARTGVAVRSR